MDFLGILTCLLLVIIEVQYCLAVELNDCSRGKYLWKDDSPNVFFYCYSEDNAVKMKCRQGYYMCKIPGKPFEPCDCTEEGQENSINQSPEEQFTDPLPSDGCPDPYLAYFGQHMFDGMEKPEIKYLGACQKRCQEVEGCIGVDWERKSKKCFLIFTGALKYGLVDDDKTDHYRKENCLQAANPEGEDPVPTPATPSIPVTTPILPGDQIGRSNDPGMGMAGSKNNVPDDEMYQVGQAQYVNRMSSSNGNEATGNDVKYDQYQSDPNMDAGDRNGANVYSGTPLPAAKIPDPPQNEETTTTTTTTTTTITPEPRQAMVTMIPDSGCPYSLEKYMNKRHSFGVNITSGNVNNNFEDCKRWCLQKGFCEAVDFDFNINNCYYFPETNDGLLEEAPFVTHVRKTVCAPPLKCWSHGPMVASDPRTHSIRDFGVPQINCKGMCYTTVYGSQSGEPTMIERGCDENATSIQCELSPQDATEFTCTCDTARCNGLSVNALAGQILYLPLNGDLKDHSSNSNTFGQPASGFKEPEYTCLVKAVNCSAVFTGDQCVSVPEVALDQLGLTDPANQFNPQASFAVWFRRLPDGPTAKGGIVGNSEDDTMKPSWQIVAEADDNYISAGIETSDTLHTNLDDFFHSPASAGDWHLAVLTYSGQHDITNGIQATTQFYIDGNPMIGNTRTDRGNISLGKNPVTVGCVSGYTFKGLIDEVRVFAHTLSIEDMDALRLMMDANFL